MRPRILFVGENATMAHIARPAALAQCLSPEDFEVFFACSPETAAFAPPAAKVVHLEMTGPKEFARRLRIGAPLFDRPTLRRYIAADRALIEQVQPDLIVADLRLSLAVSARLCRVPYANITNAHWLPRVQQPMPLGEHPLSTVLGIPLAHAAFRLIRPLAFAYHAHSYNAVFRENGLPGLPGDMRHIHSAADHVLLADWSGLVDLPTSAPHEFFLGPVHWSYPAPDPTWWRDLPDDRPLIWIGLGSSGRADQLAEIVAGAADLPATVVVTASPTPDFGPHVYAASPLHAERLCRRATVVVSNGGAPTTYQALACGRPVLGVACNMDQRLFMQAVARHGAGTALWTERVSRRTAREALARLLDEAAFTAAAQRMAAAIPRFEERFQAFTEPYRKGGRSLDGAA